MTTATTQTVHTYEGTAGTLWLIVEPAEIDEQRRSDIRIRPRVRVTSGIHGDVRERYGIAGCMLRFKGSRPISTDLDWAHIGEGTEDWQRRTRGFVVIYKPYQMGGHRWADGTAVGAATKADEAADRYCRDALVWLHQTHPDWRNQSIAQAYSGLIRHQEYEIKNAEIRIANAHKEITRLEVERAKYQD